jgi:hypothetical protein
VRRLNKTSTAGSKKVDVVGSGTKLPVIA